MTSALLQRRVRLWAVACAATFGVGGMGTAIAEARTDNRLKVVVFVHGLDAIGPDFGNNCEGTWGDMIDAFRAWGWSNTFNPVKYYHADTNCNGRGTLSDGRPNVSNQSIDHHGSHTRFWAGGHRDGSHTADTSIRHLAYHYAWWMYDHYSKDGRTVDVVGHSMGGLINRYAINAVQRGFADFPPKLLVEDIVTLGSPHSGSALAYGCGWTQCKELRSPSDSTFMAYLRDNAQNPQGYGGTNWTVIGSNDDRAVASGSATAMSVPHRTKYIDEGIGHSDYMHRTRTTDDANVHWWKNSESKWYAWHSYNWPVVHTDRSLVLGTR